MNTKHPTRVLLVDDDEDHFLLLRDLLGDVKGQKFNVEWAPSYEHGKTILLQHIHDVCFMDYRLGAKTGLDLIKDVTKEGCKTPIILLTGFGEPEVDVEAMKVGAADYLVKDQVSSILLERSIRYSIHRAQSLKALYEREAQILVQDRLASVGLLASSLAHEIGTPLGVIRGRAEFLEIQVKDNPDIKKNVDVIISQIDRVSKLIHSLLNLARGDQTKHAERINLNEVVSEVLDLMQHELTKKSIRLFNELPKNIPIKVKVEAGPLHQVLLNLFVNAVFAIGVAIKKGRTADHFLRLSLTESDSHWILTIEDSGCGISEKDKKHIFKPFFTTKDIGVGTGLGLATCYGIIESWGGSIGFTSQEGRGTEFKIQLPRPQDGQPSA